MRLEVQRCRDSFLYFVDNYVQVLSDAGGSSASWMPFQLWPEQRPVAQHMQDRRLLVILKARQLGLTWLTLAFVLWLVLFRPIATVLLFSRRDDEAVDLLKTRLRGMYDRLPEWLKVRSIDVDNDHEWQLSNGSRALAFPTTAGDSYTATLAVVDEADLCPDLDRLMRAVKPTIDGGGRMILLSRSDKSKPQSPFKRIYSSARQGLTDWLPIFLPWSARPGRTAAWYEAQVADSLARTGSLDDVHEQYPASDVEALAARSLDKRIAPEWLQQCYVESKTMAALPKEAPSIPGLEVFAPPDLRRRYIVGIDPAEGKQFSHDSALEVLDVFSGEQVACLARRLEPAVIAAHADAIGAWYNRAVVMVLRNNHGHAVLLWLRDHSGLRRLPGYDGLDGWVENSKGKALLYDACADAFRERDATVHSFATYSQLASIEGATLKAPDGEPDDRADAYAAACVGRRQLRRKSGAPIASVEQAAAFKYQPRG